MTQKILLALLVVLAFAIPQAQTPDPSTLPLVQQADLQYLGGFRVPDTQINSTDLSYGGTGVAFDAERKSLFLGSVWNRVAEITIPALVSSSDPMSMQKADYKQNAFVDPTEGHMSGLYDGSVLLGGLFVRNGRLTVTAAIYYDAMGSAQVSHFARSTSLTTPSFSGWSKVGDRPGFVAGYMADIPAEHQARLGGTAVTGQCCLPIITRTSFGPAAFAFDPGQIGQANVPAVPLVYYDAMHPTLGQWGEVGGTEAFSATATVSGVVIVPGTRSALFFGRNGLGPYCYGEGTANKDLVVPGSGLCYDPITHSKGQHGYPYRYQIWAYDLNDFAAVRAGLKQPWQVVPYGVWPIAQLSGEIGTGIGGVGFDAATQTIYVSHMGGQIIGCCGVMPVIHAFRATAAVQPPPPPPPPPPVDPQVAALQAKLAEIKAVADAALARIATLKPNSKPPAYVIDALKKAAGQ